MIAVDTNLLVYAHRADSDWHDRAEAAVRGLAEGAEPWAIPWPCLHEFIAIAIAIAIGIATHPRIYQPPSPFEVAARQVEAWLASPSLVLLTETTAHWPALRSVLGAGRVVGPKVHDARIAALCIQHGVRELWSADRDFGGHGGARHAQSAAWIPRVATVTPRALR